MKKNDHASWSLLLHFSVCCQNSLGPQYACSLASAINSQIKQEEPPPCPSSSPPLGRKGQSQPLKKGFPDLVAAKLEEGDFQGAVRLVTSEDTLAPLNNETFEELLRRHPPLHSEPSTSLLPLPPSSPLVSEEFTKSPSSPGNAEKA